jgi:hypothetical protein
MLEFNGTHQKEYIPTQASRQWQGTAGGKGRPSAGVIGFVPLSAYREALTNIFYTLLLLFKLGGNLWVLAFISPS